MHVMYNVHIPLILKIPLMLQSPSYLCVFRNSLGRPTVNWSNFPRFLQLKKKNFEVLNLIRQMLVEWEIVWLIF